MHYRIDTFQAGGAFAQWPGGHEPAIAEAEIGSDNGNFRVAGERVVLQTVVSEDEAGGGIIAQQFFCRFGTFACDHHRRTGAAPEHQRLITDYGSIRAGGDVGCLPRRAALTPAYYANCDAFRL